MRLCSPLSLFVLLGPIALTAALAGCYPHQGKPVDAAPPKLLELAHDACRRHDADAWQMLLSRLAEQHPTTSEGQRARQLLDSEPNPMASCARTLQTAETQE